MSKRYFSDRKLITVQGMGPIEIGADMVIVVHHALLGVEGQL